VREILYRAKRKDNGEWVYGYYCYVGYTNEQKHYIIPTYASAFYGIEIIPESLGQYTGLKDKNGTKIFEGDKVKFGQNIYQIVFECGGFCLLDKNGNIISKIGGMNDHCYSLVNLHLECCWEENSAYDIEIIGNIFDNKELLNEQ